MKNKKTIYNSDEFRKTVQCLTEKIREADELESVDVDKSFQDVMKRVGREKKVPHRRHIYRWSLSIAAAIALALVMNWWIDFLQAARPVLFVVTKMQKRKILR